MLITETQLKELIKKILLEDAIGIAKGVGKDILTGEVTANVNSGELVEYLESLEKISGTLSEFLGIPEVVWAEHEIASLTEIPAIQSLFKYLGSHVDMFNNLLNAPLVSSVLGAGAAVVPVVIGFAALPLAINQTLKNLASVEGMLRNHHDKMADGLKNENGEMQYDDLAEEFDGNSLIKRLSGANGREDIVKMLAVDMIAQTGSYIIAQKLHGDGIIDKDFLGKVLIQRNKMMDHHVDLKAIQKESDNQIKNKAVMLGLVCNILKASGVSLGPIGADDIVKGLKNAGDFVATVN